MLRLFTLRRFLIPAVVALFPIFALPASAAHAPAIYWTSQPVRPAETVMVAGEYFAPGTTVALRRLTDIDPKAPNMELAADGESTQASLLIVISRLNCRRRHQPVYISSALTPSTEKVKKGCLMLPNHGSFRGTLGTRHRLEVGSAYLEAVLLYAAR